MNEADPLEVLELAKAAVRALVDSPASPHVKAAALETAAQAIRTSAIAQSIATSLADSIKRAGGAR